MVVFGICKFSGGGMQFTKEVDSTDGLLDITIAKNLTLIDINFNTYLNYTMDLLYTIKKWKPLKQLL